jgi:nitronate monooxygenase
VSADLATLLGVRLPIIQAPMAGVQGADLALAVAAAGGLGSLPCAMLGADALRQRNSTAFAPTPELWSTSIFFATGPR